MRIIKRLAAVGICAACLIMCCFPASAQDPNSILLSSSLRNVDGVKYLEVSVSLNQSAAGIQGKLGFDSSVLAYSSAEIPDALSSKNTTDSSVKAKSSAVDVILVGDVKNGTSGKWITFVFRILDVDSASTSITFTDNKVSGISGEKLTFSSNGITAALKSVKGDVNSDGAVDVRDLVRFKKYFAGIIDNGLFNTDNAECDNVPGIDALDMSVLRQMLLA